MFHLDAATIERSGTGAQAVILIPGLGCGPFVFDAIASDLERDHVVYRVRFDGFDGHATIQSPFLAAYTKSIADLIARDHLQKPLLIGHSLGGHVALAIAEQEPANVGAVLAIDALPMFPPLQPGETIAARAAFANRFAQMMIEAPDDQYRALVRQNTAALVTDPKNVDLVVEHTLAGDRAAFAGAAAEMMQDDLTSNLSAITAPVTVLVPAPSAALAAQMTSGYTQLYAGTAHLRVVAIPNSKHFIMLDQPALFATAVDAFVRGPEPK
jgi:pimeloyl-ACP methyl ester carboxylesterase